MLNFIKAKWMLIVTGLGVIMALTIKILLSIVKSQKHEIKMKDKLHDLGEKHDEFERQHELEEEKANEEIKDHLVGLSVDDKFGKL